LINIRNLIFVLSHLYFVLRKHSCEKICITFSIIEFRALTIIIICYYLLLLFVIIINDCESNGCNECKRRNVKIKKSLMMWTSTFETCRSKIIYINRSCINLSTNKYKNIKEEYLTTREILVATFKKKKKTIASFIATFLTVFGKP